MNTKCDSEEYQKTTYIPEYIYLSPADLKQVPHDPALFLFGRDFNVDPSVVTDLHQGTVGKYPELSEYLRKYFEPIVPENGGPATEYVIRTRNLLAYLEATLSGLSDVREIDVSNYYGTISLADFFTKWANAELSAQDFSTFYKQTTGFSTWYDALIYFVVQLRNLDALKENAPSSAADRRDILDKIGLQVEESRVEEASESICCTLNSEDNNNNNKDPNVYPRADAVVVSGQGYKYKDVHSVSINDYVAMITKYLGHNW